MIRHITNSIRAVRLGWIALRYDAIGVAQSLPVADGLLPRGAGALRWLARRKWRKASVSTKLTALFHRLGPSYIKLGQVISTRPDLLGEELASHLTHLQDGLDGFSSDVAMATIAQELGAPVSELFAAFDPQPVSAASVAQVHKAQMPDGRDVAVKVLRPGIRKSFERDLSLLTWLAGIVDWLDHRFAAAGIIEGYREQITFETDLRLEAAAADELRQNFNDDPQVLIPAVDWQHTARNVMVLDWQTGIPIDDRAGLEAAGHNVDLVMQAAAETFFRALFRDGYFHGDQHAGNMFITGDPAKPVVLFVDFGIMGRVSREKRLFLADIMHALFQRDYQALARRYAAEGYLQPQHDPVVFALSLRAVCEPIIDQPLEKVSFARLLGQLLALGQQFGLSAQPDLFLLQKNMLMAEGISRQIAPHLNIWQVAQPLIRQWVIENKGPGAKAKELLQVADATLRWLPVVLHKADRALEGMSRDTRSERRLYWLATGFLVLFALAVVS